MDLAISSYLSSLIQVTPWKAAWALGLMILISFTEGVGLMMLVPLLQLVGVDVPEGDLSRIARLLSSVFAAVGLRPTLITVLGLYVLINGLHGFLYRLQTTVNLTLQQGFVASLRLRLYRAITDSNWLFFSRSRSSDFTHVLTAEVDRVGGATYFLLQLFATAIVTIVYILFALKVSSLMTGLVFAVGGVLILLLKGKTRVARTSGQGLSDATEDLYAAIMEHVGGMKTVKSYGAEDRHVNIFARMTERVKRMHLKAVLNQAEVKYWFDMGSLLVLSFIVYVSFEVLHISTAEVLLLLFLSARIMPRFSSLQRNYQSFVNLVPAFASVVKMQALCEASAEIKVQTTVKSELREAICFERVSLGYDQTLVIRDLSLTIRAGQTTALVGPSGAGKSTIADLAIGLITPGEGRVRVDGIPMGPEQIRSWRGQIGYVAQDTFLFHDSVRANLLWACPSVTEEAIVETLRLAAAQEFVSKLPQGLETVVGDRSVRLSGGERQRLALARALLR